MTEEALDLSALMETLEMEIRVIEGDGLLFRNRRAHVDPRDPANSGKGEDEMSAKKRKKIAPDSIFNRDSWMHLGHGGMVYIANQKLGQPATSTVTLTRREFARMAKFYESSR